MSKPQLHDLPAKYQAQAVKQLYASPRPKTIRVEQAETVKRAKKKRVPSYDVSRAVVFFDDALQEMTLAEFYFDPTRKWRFDFAWPVSRLALEVQGGIWINGGHSRGSGMERDFEKENAAICLGWRVMKCVPADLYKPATVQMLREAIQHVLYIKKSP